MFSVGSYAKIKEVETNDKYSIVKITISKKDKKTGKWDTSFVAKCSFVCDAHLQRPMAEQRIKITSCGVSNCYMKDEKLEFLKAPRYVVFGYELQEENGNKTNSPILTEMIDDGDIPF